MLNNNVENVKNVNNVHLYEIINNAIFMFKIHIFNYTL